MAEFEPGSMDVAAQERMFGSFVSFVTKACIGILLVLVFLALFVA